MKRSPAQIAVARHNSMIGLAVAIQRNADSIANSQTATDTAVAWARAVRSAAENLERELRIARRPK